MNYTGYLLASVIMKGMRERSRNVTLRASVVALCDAACHAASLVFPTPLRTTLQIQFQFGIVTSRQGGSRKEASLRLLGKLLFHLSKEN